MPDVSVRAMNHPPVVSNLPIPTQWVIFHKFNSISNDQEKKETKDEGERTCVPISLLVHTYHHNTYSIH